MVSEVKPRLYSIRLSSGDVEEVHAHNVYQDDGFLHVSRRSTLIAVYAPGEWVSVVRHPKKMKLIVTLPKDADRESAKLKIRVALGEGHEE